MLLLLWGSLLQWSDILWLSQQQGQYWSLILHQGGCYLKWALIGMYYNSCVVSTLRCILHGVVPWRLVGVVDTWLPLVTKWWAWGHILYSQVQSIRWSLITGHMSSNNHDRFSLAILIQWHKWCSTVTTLNSLVLESLCFAGVFSHSLCSQPHLLIGKQTLYTHDTPLHYHQHINQLLPRWHHFLPHVVKGITWALALLTTTIQKVMIVLLVIMWALLMMTLILMTSLLIMWAFSTVYRITGIIRGRKVSRITFFAVVHEKTFAIQVIS